MDNEAVTPPIPVPTGADIIDFSLKKAERQAETLEPIPDEVIPDTIIECQECQNKSFLIMTAAGSITSIPGHDIICTACDSIVTLTGEVLMEDGSVGED